MISHVYCPLRGDPVKLCTFCASLNRGLFRPLTEWVKFIQFYTTSYRKKRYWVNWI